MNPEGRAHPKGEFLFHRKSPMRILSTINLRLGIQGSSATSTGSRKCNKNTAASP